MRGGYRSAGGAVPGVDDVIGTDDDKGMTGGARTSPVHLPPGFTPATPPGGTTLPAPAPEAAPGAAVPHGSATPAEGQAQAGGPAAPQPTTPAGGQTHAGGPAAPQPTTPAGGQAHSTTTPAGGQAQAGGPAAPHPANPAGGQGHSTATPAGGQTHAGGPAAPHPANPAGGQAHSTTTPAEGQAQAGGPAAPHPATPAGGQTHAGGSAAPQPAHPAGGRTLGRGIVTGLWGRVEQQDFRSRIRGTLLGAALGDALGAPLTGLSLDALRTAHGPDGLTAPAPAVADGRRGRVTAATQLMLFTVDGLIRAHVRRDTGAWHPPSDVHRAYRRWAATQHDWGPDERRKDNGWLAQEEWLYARRDPDRACLTGFGDDVLATLDRPKNPAARGAAAAARSAPFGLLVGWEPALVLQLTVECAAQSHGHPTAHHSAGALAVIVHGLTRGDSLDAAVQRTLGLLGARPGHQPVTDALQRALSAVTRGAPGPDTVEALSPGHAEPDASDALAVAVYCALVAEDVAHGLRLAVNHGGDSAACGALCGALLGALHGETALPPAWLAELEGRATLLELCDDFALEMTQGPALHSPSASSPGWLARYPRG